MATELRAGRGPIQMDLSRVAPEDRTMWLNSFKYIAELARRSGQDLFAERTQWFPGFNGSISGSAGIYVQDFSMASTLPGLYAAGDAATRGYVVGASRGITFLNLAWAWASGYAAGQSAGAYARETELARSPAAEVQAAREEVTAPLHRGKGLPPDAVYGKLQAQVMDPERGLFREGQRMQAALAHVQQVLAEDLPRLAAQDYHELVKCHEAIATAHTAACMWQAALLRTESRGWHYREDFPQRDDERWLRWIILRKEGEKLVFTTQPVPRASLAALGLLPAERRH
jgi:succinate dehydrogenase/fumarate reductase flavoprotein subunit